MAVDILQSIWQTAASMSASEADHILQERYPAWRLRLDSTIVAANQLALYVWGARRINRYFDPESLFGQPAFRIFEGNLDRIPIGHQNRSFFLAKFKLIFKLYGDDPDAPFSMARLRNSFLRDVWEEAISDPELGDVWDYRLTIRPIEHRQSVELLQFQTRVTAVYSNTYERREEGYVASYNPIDETARIIDNKFKELYDPSGVHRYIAYSGRNGGELPAKEQNHERVSEGMASQHDLSESRLSDRAVITIDEAINLYQGDWLIMEVTRVDEDHYPAEGVVVARAAPSNPRRSKTLAAAVAELRRAGKRCYVFCAEPRVRTMREVREAMAEGIASGHPEW
jgi:hypothetical protein